MATVKERFSNPGLSANVRPARPIVLKLGPANVAASDTTATVKDAVTCPIAGEIVSIKFVCLARTGTATAGDVWNQTGTPATVLTTVTDMDAAAALITAAGSLDSAKKAVAANDVLTLRGAAGGGESITGLSAVVTIIPTSSAIRDL